MLVLEGRAFHRGRLDPLAIGIEDGTVARIAKDGSRFRDAERLDYGDRLILPGGVDLHVHFRDPPGTDEEDFFTGSQAAAIGGVTTVADMPNTDPPVTSVAALGDKMRAMRAKANVDFGLYAAIRSAEDVRRFANRAIGGKLYMAPSAGDLQVQDEATWRNIVATVAETQTLLVTHAEHFRELAGEPGNGLAGHDDARPPRAEAAAIQSLDDAAKAVPKPPKVHIAHVTSRAAVEALNGTRFTAEATPHHLFLDRTGRMGAFGKVNPPLRTPEDRRALWEAFVDGRISCVASDHAPRTIEAKQESFEKAPPGVPGVETMLPLLLARLKRGDLTVDRFVEATAKKPSEILGLQRGVLEVGRTADLVVVDPRKITAIRAKSLHSKCGWTPFEGLDAVFPEAVYLSGELLVDQGSLVAERRGRPVPRLNA